MRGPTKKILDCTGCGATEAAMTYWQTDTDAEGNEVADEYRHTCGSTTVVPR